MSNSQLFHKTLCACVLPFSHYRSLYEIEKYPHVVENHVVEIHVSQGIAVDE